MSRIALILIVLLAIPEQTAAKPVYQRLPRKPAKASPPKPAPAVKVTPAKGPGLQVNVSAVGARVFLDNVEMGEAPLKAISGLKPGAHILKVVKPGYSEYLETVSIQPAKVTTVAVDLVALFGVVTIEANIAGAVVAIDNKSVGPAPIASKELIPGEHVVKVTSDGYKDFETTLRVAAGEEKLVKATLVVKPDDKQRVAVAGPDLSPKPSNGSAGAIRFTPPEDVGVSSSPPLYKRWWVWAIAGGVVAGAVTTGIAMKSTQPGSPYLSKPGETAACKGACAAVFK